MKSVFIPAATVAALGVLVALPVAFVVLQAVFRDWPKARWAIPSARGARCCRSPARWRWSAAR